MGCPGVHRHRHCVPVCFRLWPRVCLSVCPSRRAAVQSGAPAGRWGCEVARVSAAPAPRHSERAQPCPSCAARTLPAEQGALGQHPPHSGGGGAAPAALHQAWPGTHHRLPAARHHRHPPGPQGTWPGPLAPPSDKGTRTWGAALMGFPSAAHTRSPLGTPMATNPNWLWEAWGALWGMTRAQWGDRSPPGQTQHVFGVPWVGRC